jgi:hypothetical protein
MVAFAAVAEGKLIVDAERDSNIVNLSGEEGISRSGRQSEWEPNIGFRG